MMKISLTNKDTHLGDGGGLNTGLDVPASEGWGCRGGSRARPRPAPQAGELLVVGGHRGSLLGLHRLLHTGSDSEQVNYSSPIVTLMYSMYRIFGKGRIF